MVSENTGQLINYAKSFHGLVGDLLSCCSMCKFLSARKAVRRSILITIPPFVFLLLIILLFIFLILPIIRPIKTEKATPSCGFNQNVCMCGARQNGKRAPSWAAVEAADTLYRDSRVHLPNPRLSPGNELALQFAKIVHLGGKVALLKVLGLTPVCVPSVHNYHANCTQAY